jgi:beta/gamma crystallin
VPKATPRPVAPKVVAPKAPPRVVTPKAPPRVVAPKATPKITPKPTPKAVPKTVTIPKSTPGPKVGPIGGPKTGPKSVTKTGPTTGPKVGPKPDPKGATKTGPLTGPGIKKGPDIKKGPIAGPGTKTGPDIKKGPIAGPGTKTGPDIKKGPIAGPGTKTGPIAGPGKKTGPIAGPGKKKIGPTKGPGTKVAPVGPGKIGPKGPRTNVTIINRRNVPIFRGGRTIFVGRDIRRIVAVSTLAAIAVGAVYYYPYGYVAISRPVCRGVTAEGCTLRWQDVATEEGDVVTQCVQYCPQGYVAPPPVPLVSPAPVPVPGPPVAEPDVGPAPAGCDIAIYSEANFGGVSSETGEDQPQLGEVGWAEEIASIEIKAGTWDFYSEEEFGGETIRLGTGSYPVLPDNWGKRINSFMCADPAG